MLRALGALHAEAGRDPTERDLSHLFGELATQSETFRTLWAAHDVHVHDRGVKRLGRVQRTPAAPP
jgi:MmyB-like transcription regulator ligand binding domain